MKAKWVVMAAACGVGAALAFWFFTQRKSDPRHVALVRREVATRMLAESLVASYRGKKALVISNPFTAKGGQNPQIYQFEQAGIDGLKKGFGNAITMQVAHPALRADVEPNPAAAQIDPDTTTPLSFLVAEDSFDKLAREHADCELIVSLIGLPAHLNRVKSWHGSVEQKFALLLPDWRLIGGREAIRSAFKSGKLAVAIANKPGAPAESGAMSGKLKENFDRSFLLITSANIDEVIQQYPQIF